MTPTLEWQRAFAAWPPEIVVVGFKVHPVTGLPILRLAVHGHVLMTHVADDEVFVGRCIIPARWDNWPGAGSVSFKFQPLRNPDKTWRVDDFARVLAAAVLRCAADLSSTSPR